MATAEARTEEVKQAFESPALCLGAENCARRGQAIRLFCSLSNQIALEEGQGYIIFPGEDPGPCPNSDQLLCQERLDNLAGATDMEG